MNETNHALFMAVVAQGFRRRGSGDGERRRRTEAANGGGDVTGIDHDFIREQFPARGQGMAFFDNAGGSQVAQPVIDRMVAFMRSANVQLGASYATSVEASRKVSEGRAALATLMNAARPEEVVMGATTTQLFDQLARSLVQTWRPGDRVIVTGFDHEANIAPWRKLG